MAEIAETGAKRWEREEAVAKATAALLNETQAQHTAIKTLVEEAQSARATERRHFRLTLSVALVAAIAAIVAAVAAVIAITR